METLDYRDPQGSLSALASDPMMRQMMERQQKGYDQMQEQLGRTRQASQAAAEADELSPLAAAAMAAGKTPSTEGGFGQFLASVGGAYGASIAAQKQRALLREQQMLKDIGSASAGGRRSCSGRCARGRCTASG